MTRYSLRSLTKLAADPRNIPKAGRLLAGDVRAVLTDSERRRIWFMRNLLAIDTLWYKWRYGTSGEDVFDYDWDNLIILDACRPELLREVIPNEAIETKVSPASQSDEFMRSTFYGKVLHDTVYVTANPYAMEIPAGTFHTVENLVESEWDADVKTVQPEDVVRRALSTHDRYPHKRLVIHFMQPHFPFLGETGSRIPSGFDRDPETTDSNAPHPWFDKLWGGGEDHELLLRAYRENHEYVVPYVNELVAKLDGKSVITADHANLVGERGFPVPIRLYGHPRGLRHPALVKVPWVNRNEDAPRRLIRSDPPVSGEEIDEDVLRGRLESLGYV